MEVPAPLHVHSTPKKELDSDEPTVVDANRMVVKCSSSSSFILGLVHQQTILLSMSIDNIEASLYSSFTRVYHSFM